MEAHDPLKLSGETLLEKYRIERWVTEGGFSVVYRAEHTVWKQPVAIKFSTALASVPEAQRAEFQEAFISPRAAPGSDRTTLSATCGNGWQTTGQSTQPGTPKIPPVRVRASAASFAVARTTGSMRPGSGRRSATR